ncbi:MAG: hypothetical protein K940chlam9_00714 [Chlamydiae bacterium]|nr:hypothetical protein [Chlamydiota bacterium]
MICTHTTIELETREGAFVCQGKRFTSQEKVHEYLKSSCHFDMIKVVEETRASSSQSGWGCAGNSYYSTGSYGIRESFRIQPNRYGACSLQVSNLRSCSDDDDQNRSANCRLRIPSQHLHDKHPTCPKRSTPQ